MEQTERTTIVNAEHIKDINVKSDSDIKECYIMGVVALPDNRLVISDFHNEPTGKGNKIVKLYDVDQEEVIAQLSFSSSPCDAVRINNTQVAVTLPDVKKVAVINVEASAMTIDRTLDVAGKCYRIDYRDDKLVLSFLDTPKLQVLTLQGKVLHTITKAGVETDTAYTYLSVAFCHDNTSMYVSNLWCNYVDHVKFDGTLLVKYMYQDYYSSGPCSLRTDSSGNVYVCNLMGNSIYKITPDCRSAKAIVNTDLYLPSSLDFSETEKRLYVANNYNDFVKVYKVIIGPMDSKEDVILSQ